MLKIKIKQATAKIHSHSHNLTEKMTDMLFCAKALGDFARRFTRESVRSTEVQSKVQKDLLHALTVMINNEDEELDIALIEDLFNVRSEEHPN